MIEFWEVHEKGDSDCPGCWQGYPVRCGNCGELVHAEFGDEDWDCNYYLNYECENCGADYIIEI